ncbi:MAG: hypothetical protein P0Y49_10920 [Candidatus Pedobacter colombiensis]|uniref:Uncharacterized protein n=1 Tax=Candidatus Pedobacter colombiensis TaxID=3121371 RepID=A0AAJ6BAV1_9SPHI|nr:hypothetical protein [Pedobacter sp.]WEK21648.1 MAG: hypothetical protein P0Y49_10920 [Pedobacter sp.]
MKRSNRPTNQVIIKANTNSDWDCVDFAIIHLAASWRTLMSERLLTAQSFVKDTTFHNLNYWDVPSGYYLNTEKKLYTETILYPGKDWTFITLEPGEEESFAVPKNSLEAHQLCITPHLDANFKAFSTHTNEEYWTESFYIPHMLATIASTAFDSS